MVGYMIIFVLGGIVLTKLECSVCDFKQDVPTVCCGPGVPNMTDPNRLDCPAGPAHGSIDMPKYCRKPMKYVE